MKSGGLVVDQGCSLTCKCSFSPEYCGVVIGIADMNGWCVISATMWQNDRPNFCHKDLVGFLHVYINIKQMKWEKRYFFFQPYSILSPRKHSCSVSSCPALLFSLSLRKILFLLFNDFQCVVFYVPWLWILVFWPNLMLLCIGLTPCSHLCCALTDTFYYFPIPAPLHFSYGFPTVSESDRCSDCFFWLSEAWNQLFRSSLILHRMRESYSQIMAQA